MLAQSPPNNTFQITLPVVNQTLTFDDLRSISPAALEESAHFAGDASSCHSSTMQHTFAYNTTEKASQFDPLAYDSKTATLQNNTAYTLPLSSPTQSLISHSIESDFAMEGSHGPSTPEEWSTMLSEADKAYQQSWNGGSVAPYYNSYAAQDMSCQASQIAHIGAGFDNQPAMHPSEDLLATTTGSAYPAFVSMAPLPYGHDLSSAIPSSAVPRGFSQHSDAFPGLLVPSVDSDARHSSPSSFSTGDDATTNTRASSVSIPRKRHSRDMKKQQRRPSPVSVCNSSHAILPYPTPSSGTPNTLPSMRTLADQTIPECKECNLTFRDIPTLQKHIKSEHTRPLLCVFHYAGCTSRFASKNEWKRHVASQHLALRYWICTEGTCGQTRGPSTRSRAASLPVFGSIFNRKDLYTQHIRRMHLAPEGSPLLGASSKKPIPAEIEDRMRELQANAARTRCALPRFMVCPAPGCPSEFHGPNAWDDRMEHVACHLERAAAGEEPPVTFGGPADWTLTDWAVSDGVNVTRQTSSGTWKLCNPLRGEGGSSRSGGRSRVSVSARRASMARHGDDEDAEGEDCTAWSR
ncbi:Zinc finger, C2H2-like protein [Cordyceps fumosorosea ARSEF 2679]|uniref:Zinc finger, C2H2-like protein n=1 Tax=Cordyceps fumosorosea (strain ARSEF 2679) TaxID=1081104 RepID=A0A167QHT3_CORFA|nr:Zinc finger, C2H2-like protein [Cordyceps fumosorosea ARSEF 2679]OAA57656.1 Zinc finger, C2H2-like protein [Cordyceps fumosorosea ARSEF 2679]